MIDAEHSYFQPAIDHTAHVLSLTYNRGQSATVYNTYQAYLTGSANRLAEDMERARREGYRFAAKLVSCPWGRQRWWWLHHAQQECH